MQGGKERGAERVAAGADLPSSRLFERAKRPDDRSANSSNCCYLLQCEHQVLVYILVWTGMRHKPRLGTDSGEAYNVGRCHTDAVDPPAIHSNRGRHIPHNLPDRLNFMEAYKNGVSTDEEDRIRDGGLK